MTTILGIHLILLGRFSTSFQSILRALEGCTTHGHPGVGM